MFKKILDAIQNKTDETMVVSPPPADPSGWMIDNGISQFLLMKTSGIMYMCMFLYAFVHGKKCSDLELKQKSFGLS